MNIRALLAATALTTSLSFAALAQDTTVNSDADTAAAAQTESNMEAGNSNAMADGTLSAEADTNVSLSAGYMHSGDDFLGSRIIGATVWSSSAADADKIGDVNDVIFNKDGRMIAAVIGIGGFLEIGEKSVAVGFNELEWTNDVNGEPRLVLTGATYASLEAAPEFSWNIVDLTADPLMSDTGGAMDTSLGADLAVDANATLGAEADVETDALLDAEGDTVVDTDATAGAVVSTN